MSQNAGVWEENIGRAATRRLVIVSACVCVCVRVCMSVCACLFVYVSVCSICVGVCIVSHS